MQSKSFMVWRSFCHPLVIPIFTTLLLLTLLLVPLLVLLFTPSLFAQPVQKLPAQPTASSQKNVLPSAYALKPKWKVFHYSRGNEKGVRPLSKKSALVSVSPNFKFMGPRPNDPFLLGDFTIDGKWNVQQGMIQKSDGRNAALVIAEGENFELQSLLSAEGLGGWFFLVGWKDGHGYAIYNVNLKTSGSPWMICEFRAGKGIEATHKEFTRYECKGKQPVVLSVVEKKLTLSFGRRKLADKIDLPNYHQGAILVGTYDTKYGSRPIKIQSLRARSVVVKPPKK